MINVLDLDLDATKQPGQKVVNRGENNKEDEAKNPQEDRHEKVNDADYFKRRATKDNHRNTDESVDKSHQDIHGSHDLAGLQN